ncbi:FAD-dependent oxidoreductase [Roseomonas sp. GC11]|uniref:dihydrolipoyl dehydrogenase family protein n=1 Tax=Roseomonas sp. GC11 TaxID=2950546 RepID=UPI00210E9F68|nr:FAD-dependent oxidoreductase [Roseomonas sp. GC11]MCQ4158718.1 FAD-dependent oxidoreductase [Roseomonas sp. GC11]
MPDHDVAIIGAGSAGLAVAATAASLGLKVALFERERMGGRRQNSGAIPSQALLAAAHRAAALRREGPLGVRAEGVTVDWAAVRRHVQGSIARIAPQDSEAHLRALGVTVVHASAHFVAPDRIEAAGRVHGFRRAVVAAGSAPVVPDLPGMVGLPWLTLDTLFELEAPPAHLLVIGGSAEGVEMAQAHARLGCRVTLLEAGPTLLAREEPELRLPLREQLRQDGVEILENSRVIALAPAAEGLAAVLESGARIAASHLLFALGRAPRLAPLDLVAAQVEATAQGITTGADLRSPSNRRVWAAGSIADPEGLGPRYNAPLAGQHAAVVAPGLLFRRTARLDYAALPRFLGTAPELLQIGLTEAEARAAGHAPRILRQPFAENGRAVAEGETEGMVKLVLDAQGRLLGAGVLGQGAGEMAGMLGLMISQGLPLDTLSRLALPSPTRSEAIRRAAPPYHLPGPLSALARQAASLLARLP